MSCGQCMVDICSVCYDQLEDNIWLIKFNKIKKKSKQ